MQLDEKMIREIIEHRIGLFVDNYVYEDENGDGYFIKSKLSGESVSALAGFIENE